MDDNKFQDLMTLTHVPRWAIIPLTKPQSVAEHTYRVMVISLNLAKEFNEAASELDIPGVEIEDIMSWAMDHDGTESKTGDLPTPFKLINYEQVEAQAIKACPWYKRSLFLANFDNLVKQIVSVADTIEALMYITVYGTNRSVEKEIIKDMSSRIDHELQSINKERLTRQAYHIMSLVGISVPKEYR